VPAAPAPPAPAPPDGAAPAAQDARPARARGTAISRALRGPFASSRLFAMPTADVVGAYVLTLSGDASLLQEPGVLTSAGVVSIGFGDIAQLEYRHTAAITVTGIQAPLPAAGVQIKIPLPERASVPALGFAFRLGVPRTERLAELDVRETVTDLYLVARLRLGAAPWLTLHGGARVSSARLELAGPAVDEGARSVRERLVLPTAGYELAMTPRARIVGELALAPRFVARAPDGTGGARAPGIGYGALGRLGMRWRVVPAVVVDASINYQADVGELAGTASLDAVVAWDIRLGAEVLVPWGALACRATGVFCD
jgi:hypothetical protein